MTRQALVLFWLLAGLSLGCSARVPQSLEKARARRFSELASSQSVLVRHNPVSCSCPAFEVQVDDGWLRVDIVASRHPDFPVEELPVRLDASGGSGQMLRLELETNRLFRCPNGSPYLQVTLEKPEETAD